MITETPHVDYAKQPASEAAKPLPVPKLPSERDRSIGSPLAFVLTASPTITVVFVDRKATRQMMTFGGSTTQGWSLGVCLKESTPAAVSRVVANSCAEEFGVEVGWTVVELNGHDVGHKNGRDVTQMLAAFAWQRSIDKCDNPESEASVSMCFEVEGKLKALEFKESPLGIVFKPEIPFVVARVIPGSFAEQMGVQQGWALVQLAEQDVREMDWEVVVRQVAVSVRGLPK